MGKTQSYVRGGGSHSSVPIPLNTKVELYRSSKRLVSGNRMNSQGSLGGGDTMFDPRGKKKIDWDIQSVSE